MKTQHFDLMENIQIKPFLYLKTETIGEVRCLKDSIFIISLTIK